VASIYKYNRIVKEIIMKIAIPVKNNTLCNHFGHCEQFFVCDVDSDKKSIAKSELVTPPPHEPGLLPRWLGEKDVNVIIAGGMGQKAQNLFTQRNIKVFVGAPALAPKILVDKYLNNQLVYGVNACDH